MPDYKNTFEQEIDFEEIELTEEEIKERVDRSLEERERQEKERIFAEIERKRREEEDQYIAALDPQNGLNKLPVYRRNKADAIQYTEKEFYYALSNSPEFTEQINKLKQVEAYPDGTALSAEDSAQMKMIIKPGKLPKLIAAEVQKTQEEQKTAKTIEHNKKAPTASAPIL